MIYWLLALWFPLFILSLTHFYFQVVVGESKKPSGKVKGGAHVPSQKLTKMIKTLEPASSGSEVSRKLTDEHESIGHIPAENKVILTSKQRNRRKMTLQRALMQEWKPSALVQEDRSGIYVNATSDKAVDVKVRYFSFSVCIVPQICEFTDGRFMMVQAKLSHCLSSPLLRRWCMFEWFYSAIDYPWFAKSEFVEYLDHVGLGHVPRLTRVEWGVIRR